MRANDAGTAKRPWCGPRLRKLPELVLSHLMRDKPIVANLDVILAPKPPERPARGPAVADMDLLAQEPAKAPAKPDDPAARRERLSREILDYLAQRHSSK